MTKTTSQPEVSTYDLRSRNGQHIRHATMVTFPNGEVVRFVERMSKREALRQVEWHRS